MARRTISDDMPEVRREARSVMVASLSQTRSRTGRFAFGAGDVLIEFPDGLTVQDLDDLEEYIKVQLRVMRRAAESDNG